jgi:L-alanine-DL-glutamate epimerase-like enolase superfamily enzyme
MKINRVTAWPVELLLKEPYTIAYEHIESAVNVFLRIETDAGVLGFGCAAPDSVTGENGESVLRAFEDSIEPVLSGADPLQRERLIMELFNQLQNQPAALALVDMALYDILGKVAGLPLYRLLGGYRDSIVTSITIGILPVEETVEKAREFVRKGFQALKLKGGKIVSEDVERILKVREAVGREISIRFDANQGYTVAESLEFIRATGGACVEMIEQPTPAEHPELLGRVRGSIPVMADESLITAQDAFTLAGNGFADLFNVKLMKVGGIAEAMRIGTVARLYHLGIMVGCMDESALSISAGLHLALALPEIQYADLDGHLDLKDDPADGAVILEKGVLYPTEKPGLGFEPTT